eukprot:gene7536-8973_t
MASADLLWQCVRKQNAFLHKSKISGGVQFSKEKGNLYNLSTFKYSGLCNAEKVVIEGADAEALSVSFNGTVLKSDFPAMAKKVIAGLNRPDLKSSALAKLSQTHKSLRMAKAGIKKNKAKK